jgi:Xaa-Pro aminopeptidase
MLETYERREHIMRRQRLAGIIGPHAIALIPSATTKVRKNDDDFPFVQESNFFYLTGFNEPSALLVVMGGAPHRSYLFVEQTREPERVLWVGQCAGIDRARSGLGVSDAFENTDMVIEQRVKELIINNQVTDIFYPDAEYKQEKERRIKRDLAPFFHRLAVQLPGRFNASAGISFHDVDPLIGELRLFKSAREIEKMGIAARVAAAAHRELLTMARDGLYEYELEAHLSYRFARARGRHAYQPIVASGANACVLHWTENDRRMRDGDLVLVDAGCEKDGYASDITRTFPVSGRFTREQREIYDVVLAMQYKGIAAAVMGKTPQYIHDSAALVGCEMLNELGMLGGRTPLEAFESGYYRFLFPHRIGHWLGLDVHDAGDSQKDANNPCGLRTLEHGMVLTVEPGIYVRPSPDIPERYWHIGVRIEDDVLVTLAGPRVLSSDAPKEPQEIELIMGSAEHRRYPFQVSK